jgi:hypothetical protein
MSKSQETCTCKFLTTWDDISVEINGFHSQFIIGHPWTFDKNGINDMSKKIIEYSITNFLNTKDDIRGSAWLLEDGGRYNSEYLSAIDNYLCHLPLRVRNSLNEYTLEKCIKYNIISIIFRDLFHNCHIVYEIPYHKEFHKNKTTDELTRLLIKEFNIFEKEYIDECLVKIDSLCLI